MNIERDNRFVLGFGYLSQGFLLSPQPICPLLWLI